MQHVSQYMNDGRNDDLTASLQLSQGDLIQVFGLHLGWHPQVVDLMMGGSSDNQKTSEDALAKDRLPVGSAGVHGR